MPITKGVGSIPPRFQTPLFFWSRSFQALIHVSTSNYDGLRTNVLPPYPKAKKIAFF